MVKEEALFGDGQSTALKKGDVFGLGRSKLLQKIMEVLGDFPILACHKTDDLTKSLQALKDQHAQ